MAYTAKFPIYALSYHSPSSTLILGGGGGPSRSGIPNGLVLLSLKPTMATNSAGFTLEETGELRTGDEAVMSLSLYDDKTDCLVVAGVNDRCWLMELKTKHSATSPSSRVSTIVNALNSGTPPPSPAASILQSPLSLLRTIQSDASPSDDGYLRVTRFTPAGRSFLAAGSDGSVREWGVPEMRLLSKIETDSEILDADAQDQKSALVTSKGLIQLKLSTNEEPSVIKPSPNHSFKFVRFFKKDTKDYLLAVENVVGINNKKKNPNVVLFLLDPPSKMKNLKPHSRQTLPIPKNCTCLNITQDFASFGFADGSLLVTSLAKISNIFLQKKLAHPFPVTGLAVDSKKGILMSSSADGQILISKLADKPITSLLSSSALITSFIIVISVIVLLLAFFFSQNLTKLTEIEDFDSFYKLFPAEL